MDLKCKICLIKFEQDSLLLSHININLGRKCEICLHPFTSESSTNPNNAKCRDSHIWLASQAKRLESDSLSEAPPLEMISTPHDKQFYQKCSNKLSFILSIKQHFTSPGRKIYIMSRSDTYTNTHNLQ